MQLTERRVLVSPGRYKAVTVPPCSKLGEATGETVGCPSCRGSVQLKTFACSARGVCTLEKEAPGVACCNAPGGCLDRDPPLPRPHPAALQVTTRSAGIGDHLLALTTAEGLRREYGCQVAVCSKEHPEWVRMFWPWVVTAPLKLPTVHWNHEQNKKFNEAGTSRWRYLAAEVGVTPRLPDPLPLPGDALDWALPHCGHVVLAPFAAYPERTWPLWHWLALEAELNARGFPVVILDTDAARVAPFKGAKLVNGKPARVAAVVSRAACLVGNDSGMAHLAGFLRTPAVGICHQASDRGILDLYPTVRSLHADRLTPADVAGAVVAQVRASLAPGFPADAFLGILADGDRSRAESWLPIYSALWRTVKEIGPRTIVEIGTRAGYSAWTMLDACPDAGVTGFDVEELADPAPYGGGFNGANAHARRIMAGRAFEVIPADSTKLDRLPACDLAYVDGDHCEPVAYSDLCLAERSGAKVILADDFASHEGVRLAVARFMRENPHRRGRFVPSLTGLFLIGDR